MPDRPIPRPPNLAAPRPPLTAVPAPPEGPPKFLKVKFSTYLNHRVAAEAEAQGIDKASLVKWGASELLDKLEARRKGMSHPWPWHYLTVLGVVDGEPGGVVARVHHPAACKSLPAWAHCWADHDPSGPWCPTEPGEYRIRLVPVLDDDQGDEPPERALQIQRQDTEHAWVDYG